LPAPCIGGAYWLDLYGSVQGPLSGFYERNNQSCFVIKSFTVGLWSNWVD
jgi:hypothetical protein